LAIGKKQSEAPAAPPPLPIKGPLQAESSSEWTVDGLMDRRRHERQVINTFVWYKILSEDPDSVEGIARSFDISEGGIAMVLSKPLPMEAKVFLEIGVGSLRLSAVGRIVHVKTQGDRYFIGIEFQLLPPNDRIQLQRYFRRGQP
jgi:c-di-GMP-binding flagellar brake protein YcgR